MSEPIKSVEKLLKILSCYSLERWEWSLKELHEETGYTKSTIFRLLATLVEHGYIEQNPANQKYRLGFRFFHLGSIVQNTIDYRSVALSLMQRLAEETNETIEINIIENNERVCIEKVDSPEVVRNFVRIGERNKLHLGASGKILLAHLDSERQEAILKAYGLPNEEIKAIMDEMRSIREDGYAITRGERVPGSFAIAVPIRNHTGQVIAGLTMAGPIQRLTEEHLNDCLKKMLVGGREISERLGHIEKQRASF